ncbi:MAG: type II toxin-antitoxin system VapC family toxin [Hyphomicrobium sp.]
MTGIESLSRQFVYLDANVFIYAVEDFPPFSDLCRVIFHMIDEGLFAAATSELTLSEVLVGPFRDGNARAAKAYEDMLTERARFTVEPVSRSVLYEAAQTRATTGCRLPDAIHVTTARACKCDVILSADRRLKPPHGCRLLRLDQLKINKA